MIIFFFFGTGFLWLLGGGLILLVLLGGALAEWLVAHAVTVGIVLLVFWLIHSVTVFAQMQQGSLGKGLALGATAVYCLPQLPFWLLGYRYLLRQIEEVGTGSAIFDFAICVAVYTLIDIAWERIVARDGKGPVGTAIWTLLHLCATAFFIWGFCTM